MLAALLKNQIKEINSWARSSFDDVMLSGNNYYRKFSSMIHDANSESIYKLIIENVTDSAEIFDYRCDYSTHLLNKKIKGNNFAPLKAFLETHNQGIIFTEHMFYGILKNDSYYFIDCSSLGNKGAPTRKNNNGRAGIFELSTFDMLSTILRRNLHLNKNSYNILEIEMILMSKSPKPNYGLIEIQNDDDLNRDLPVQSSILMPIDRPQPSVKEYIDISDDEENTEESINLASLRRKTGNNIVNQNHELKAEELSWIGLFPYGINGLNNNRPVRITPLDYFQYRLMGEDPRFQKTDYLFYALSMYEYLRAKSNIAVCGKKVKQNNALVQDIHLYVKNLRGSGAYWTTALNQLLAQIATLGVPTYFC